MQYKTTCHTCNSPLNVPFDSIDDMAEFHIMVAAGVEHVLCDVCSAAQERADIAESDAWVEAHTCEGCNTTLHSCTKNDGVILCEECLKQWQHNPKGIYDGVKSLDFQAPGDVPTDIPF